MKTYYLYIDESGPFKHPNKEYKSLVGGFLTEEPPENTLEKIDDVTKKFHTKYPEYEDKLTAENIHSVPILHPQAKHISSKERETYLPIDEEIRIEFIDGYHELIQSIATHYISSLNEQFAFYQAKPQNFYGNCLIALFQKVVRLLKDEHREIELYFAFAYRSDSCLPENKNHKSYHQELTKYLQTTYTTQSSFVVKSIMAKDIKILLNLADVVCYGLRYDQKQFSLPSDKIYKITPEKSHIDTEKEVYRKHLAKLIKQKEFIAAYRFARKEKDKEEVISKIPAMGNERDYEQLLYFLNLVYQLIDQRTIEKNTLTKAVAILDKILVLLKDETDFNSDFKDLKKGALNAMMTCKNHSGNIGSLNSTITSYQDLLKNQYDKPLLIRYAEILDIRNRAYNKQFNNYQFEQIIYDLESGIIDGYHELLTFIKKNKLFEHDDCYLYSKVLSTYAQAYAFMSASEPEYFTDAERNFEKSLEHLKVLEDLRTPCYLATLYWYHQQPDDAYATIQKYHQGLSTEDIQGALAVVADSCDSNTLFIYALLLRVLDAKGLWNANVLKQIKTHIQKLSKVDIHPQELIYKLVATGYLKMGIQNNSHKDIKKAESYYDKAIKIDTGFTLKTIMLSSQALKIICQRHRNACDIEHSQKCFHDSLHALMRQSPAFSEYIKTRGGQEKLDQDIADENIDIIVKWLPFTYA